MKKFLLSDILLIAIALVLTGCGKSNSNYKAKPFSVSASKQVYFSPGNLQYHPANNVWRFAESQLDYVGKANENISSTYNDWIDLFGWSVASASFGVNTSIEDEDYYGSFVDWGTNKIGNDAPNTWRTFTYEEWYYLLYNRNNARSLCGIAQVNGVNGLILLPDNWKCPSGVTFKSDANGNSNATYHADFQTFTDKQWSKLESAGAVFFPAAGDRFGANVDGVQNYGSYWSATKKMSSGAFCFRFNHGGTGMAVYERLCGLSVRLVKDL